MSTANSQHSVATVASIHSTKCEIKQSINQSCRLLAVVSEVSQKAFPVKELKWVYIQCLHFQGLKIKSTFAWQRVLWLCVVCSKSILAFRQCSNTFGTNHIKERRPHPLVPCNRPCGLLFNWDLHSKSNLLSRVHFLNQLRACTSASKLGTFCSIVRHRLSVIIYFFSLLSIVTIIPSNLCEISEVITPYITNSTALISFPWLLLGYFYYLIWQPSKQHDVTSLTFNSAILLSRVLNSRSM